MSRNTALARKFDYDEVPVISNEVLETHVAAIRVDLNELKTDFRAAVARIDIDMKTAVARIDNDIKTAVTKLENEIRATAARAASDLNAFATRIETQLAEMRQEDRALRDRIDDNYKTLNAKIDRNFEIHDGRLNELDRKVTHIDSKLTALFWVMGGLSTLILAGTGFIAVFK